MPSWIALVWRVGVSRADHEVVGVAEHVAQVELDDVDRLLVGGEARDLARELGSLHQLAARARAPYRPCSATYPATAVADELLDRLTGGRALTHERRGDVDHGRIQEMHAGRIAQFGERRQQRLTVGPRARRDRQRGEPQQPDRLAPARQRGAMSAPRISVSSACGWLACIAVNVSTVYDGPSRSSSSVHTESAAASSISSRHIASRCSQPGSSASCLCGAARAGVRATCCRSSSARAWRASAR